MYESQIRIYQDPQIAEKRGFLRAIPCLAEPGTDFTYHASNWHYGWVKKGTWFDHPFVHTKAAEISSNQIVMLFRRSWLSDENALYELLEKWVRGHQERELIIVTDDPEELKISSVHVRCLTDLQEASSFFPLYENWLFRMGHVTGQARWNFRSKSVLLQSLAYIESRLGSKVETLQDLVKTRDSLLTLGLARKIYTASYPDSKYPLAELTSQVVAAYIEPYLGDKGECEIIIEELVSLTDQYPSQFAPDIRSKLNLFVPKNTVEQQMLRLVKSCVV